jgi:hypothetical protein
MGNDKQEQASRNPFAKMLEEIQEDNELRKESTNLGVQLEQMKKATAELKEVKDSLDVKLGAARHIVSSVEKAVNSAQKILLDNYSLLTELKNLKIPASLDGKAVAQIREEHGKLMSDYNASFEKLKLDEEKMLAEHRQKVEQVKDGESVWLSYKAWIWAIIVFEFLLVVTGVVVYYWTKSKFT